jgi:uncharacterized protein (TIGR03437 family)
MKTLSLPALVLLTSGIAVTAQSRPTVMPLVFEPNRGQAAPDVRYLAHGNGFMLFLTDTEAVLKAGGNDPVRMRLAGANLRQPAQGLEATGGVSNYLVGNDKSLWRTNIPQYRSVRYRNVYDGVDELFYGDRGQLEYDLSVAPGADPSHILMEYDGARSIRVNDVGDLVLETDTGDLRIRRPLVYQTDRSGNRSVIEARFRLAGPKRASFLLARYDRKRPLIIDPTVTFSTYLGGSFSDTASAIAVDSSGNTYVTGHAGSRDFPTKNPLQPSNNGSGSADAFITKINPAGTALIYSTYLGGSVGAQTNAIAVDTAGDVYVAGVTTSQDFPTQNAIQPSAKTGRGTAFLSKLNPSGSAFVFSTYFGGSGSDNALGLALDSAGNVYLCGVTRSSDFPVKNGFQSTYKGTNGLSTNGFVSKVSADGSTLVYSSYIGGSGYDGGGGGTDTANAIAVDGAGNAYLAGHAVSVNFPVLSPLQPLSPNQTKSGVVRTGFVAKVAPTGSLVYSTFLGGSSVDSANGIAVDSAADVFVTGTTQSGDFPLKNALYSATGVSPNVFVTKINPAGSALLFSTYLAGQAGSAIALDISGNAYVAGYTTNIKFPVQNPVQTVFTGQGAGFVSALLADGSALIYSTFVGGGGDSVAALAVDTAGNAYAAGDANNTQLPAFPGAFQTKLNGTTNAFVLKLGSAVTPPVASVNAASFAVGVPLAPNSIAAAFGSHLSIQTLTATGTLGTTLGGTTATVTDVNVTSSPAEIFYVSAGQMNFLVPPGLAPGKARIQVTAGDGVISVGSFVIANVTPGIFTADGKLAVGQVEQVDAQGNATIQTLVQYNSATAQFIPTPITLSSGTSTYLILYGTGIRKSLIAQSVVMIGNQTVAPLYAGIQPTFAGLDQLNIQVPNSLAGSGDVAITFTAGGITSNAVHVTVQ